MADPVGALSLLFGVVTTLHDGIGSHKVGKADIRFQLTRYRTYLYPGERLLIDQGIRSPLCQSSAERLLELHAGVAEWFEANKFRPMLGGKTKLPRWFLDKKSSSLKDHVDSVQAGRERLWDELQGVEGGATTLATPAQALRPQAQAARPPRLQSMNYAETPMDFQEPVRDEDAIHSITQRIADASVLIGSGAEKKKKKKGLHHIIYED